MATVLVVDDSVMDRHRVGAILQKGTGPTALDRGTAVEPVYAGSGEEALAAIARQAPDLVLTDLRMPGMTGLELVEAVRARYPAVPVVLMTAHGSEEVALLALQRGAAGYVPKRRLARDLLETVANVLEMVQMRRGHQRVRECLDGTESRFTLDNDPALISPLVGHLREALAEMGLCDDNELIRVSVALREALVNAICHGNLEVSSAVQEESDTAYCQRIEERRRQPPYLDRRVRLTVRQSRRLATFVIRDEGPGFNPALLPNPKDPANLEKPYGRGLLLIRTFLDEVRHNEVGNEITLVKRGREPHQGDGALQETAHAGQTG